MKTVESRAQVQAFLNTFIPKFDIWGIFFIDRQKNDEAMFPNRYAFKEKKE